MRLECEKGESFVRSPGFLFPVLLVAGLAVVAVSVLILTDGLSF